MKNFILNLLFLIFTLIGSLNVFSENLLTLKDSTYVGQIEVVKDLESYTFSENTLPSHIISSIRETMIDKKNGTYVLNYKVIEKEQKIVFRDVEVDSYKKKKFNILWVTIPILIITGFIAGYSGGP